MVRANFFDESKKLNELNAWDWQDMLPVLFILYPFVLFCIGFFDAVVMIKTLVERGNNKRKKIFITYGSTLILNFFFMLMMVVLYLLDLFTDYHVKSSIHYNDVIPAHIRWLSYIFTLLTVINPFLIGVVQISQHFFDWNKLFNCLRRKEQDIILNDDELSEVLIRDLPRGFDQLQEDSNQQFLSNIYLTIAYCMERSKMEDKNKMNEILSNEEKKVNASSNDKVQLLNQNLNKPMQTFISQVNQYKIDDSVINELHHSEIHNDEIVQSQKKYIKIKCEEHAPIIFRCLREIDGINEDMIIRSCLPALNKRLYEKSKGRSGSFFLGTHDKEFLIKSINENDIQLIKSKLLNKITEFSYQHRQSLISRLYGVYSIKINETAYHFVLMKDVCGMFQQNVISKYDLKGSQLNRKVGLEIEHVEKQVLKDINFKQYEVALRLRVNDVKTLSESIENDVVFLANNGVMDYSLLVVNIDLNLKEIETLFGRHHIERMHYEHQERMGDVDSASEKLEIEELTEEEKDEMYQKGEVRFNWRNVSRIQKHLFPTLNGNKAVILAIIDYFQVYNLNKKMERNVKKYVRGNKAENISSMTADEYMQRFLDNILPIVKGEGLLQDAKNV